MGIGSGHLNLGSAYGLLSGRLIYNLLYVAPGLNCVGVGEIVVSFGAV